MTSPRIRTFAGLSVVALTAVAAIPLAAQDHGMESTSHGLYNNDLETLERKFIALADAMPADKYGWRPMEGVRSVSEVFMLIAAENWVIPSAWDAAPPEGMEVSNELFGSLRSVTAKSEVLDHLRRSFAYYREAVGSIENMQQKIQFFGEERTVEAAMFIMTGDMHEHLGQAIAYARSNRIVPPWSQ